MPRSQLTGRQLQLFILGASVLAFGGAVLSVRLPRQVRPLEPRPAAPIRVLRGDARATADARVALADLLDPTLQSLPSVYGFSAKAWTRQPVMTYESSVFEARPATLPLAPSTSPAELITQAPVAAQIQEAAERAVVSLAATNGPPLAPVAIWDQSVARLSGALAARALIQSPRLAVIDSPVPVRPVAVRVGVSADGWVRYAMLEQGSGATAVDERAIAWAREFRFEPRAPAAQSPAYEWGVVRFYWAFAPPAGTNGPPASPPKRSVAIFGLHPTPP